MFRSFRTTLFAVLLFAAFAISPAWTQALNLGFDSLPSAQGWNYVGNVPENTVFSVSNATLRQNTVGLGGAYAWYEKDNAVDAANPFTIQMRARVLQEDNGSNYGFFFQIANGTKNYGIGIGQHEINFEGHVVATTIDGSQFHDYRLQGGFDTGYQLYVDNVLISSGTATDTNSNYLEFGDGTPTGSNARAEITRFSYSNHLFTTPAPSALLTALMGTLPGTTLLLRRRHRR